MENVRQFFYKECLVGTGLKRSFVVERTVSVTSVSIRSVQNVHKEFIAQDGASSSEVVCILKGSSKPR